MDRSSVSQAITFSSSTSLSVVIATSCAGVGMEVEVFSSSSVFDVVLSNEMAGFRVQENSGNCDRVLTNWRSLCVGAEA